MKKPGSLRLSKGHRKFVCCIILFLICAFWLLQPLHAQSLQTHPSIEPLFSPEDVLVNPNSTGGQLSADEVFKLSLLFSECPLDSSEGMQCLKQFDQLKQKVTSETFLAQPLEDRGRSVLKLLYQDYLTTYDFNQTKTNVALQTGVYNCVSSALLYMVVAKAAGLEVRGQKTSEHAFCTVYIQNKKIDVETTNPYGFNPGSKETIENEDKIQGYYVVPKKYYSNRHS